MDLSQHARLPVTLCAAAGLLILRLRARGEWERLRRTRMERLLRFSCGYKWLSYTDSEGIGMHVWDGHSWIS